MSNAKFDLDESYLCYILKEYSKPNVPEAQPVHPQNNNRFLKPF